MMTKSTLTLEALCQEARIFAEKESAHAEHSIYGITDGKAIGTYLEHKFQVYLSEKYDYEPGSSAKGIDFPELQVDIKVTRITQPQSSCPFKSARQKIYGLGHALLVFVYDKRDDSNTQTGKLDILHVIFVDESRTADFQTTTGIQRIIASDGNVDDLIAFLEERYLPVADVHARELAEEILSHPPQIGYLTISNALQWRLQYSRVIEKADTITGIQQIR